MRLGRSGVKGWGAEDLTVQQRDVDPNLAAPKLKIATTLLRKKLGFRSLLDVIPLDASLVKGSHGRPASQPAEGALLCETLFYADEVQEEPKVPEAKVSEKELDMAFSLIDLLRDDLRALEEGAPR